MEAPYDERYAYEIARLFPQQGRWRESDYFALPDSNLIIELAQGEIIVTPAPTSRHQIIVTRLLTTLASFVREHDLGTAIVSPFSIRLKPELIRQPDVLFYLAEHESRIGEQVSQPPDWCAEVISPGSRQTDEGEKLEEYAQAGISEYWLIDPEDRSVRVYTLPAGGTVYDLTATFQTGDVAASATLPGFTLAVDDLLAGTA